MQGNSVCNFILVANKPYRASIYHSLCVTEDQFSDSNHRNTKTQGITAIIVSVVILTSVIFKTITRTICYLNVVKKLRIHENKFSWFL